MCSLAAKPARMRQLAATTTKAALRCYKLHRCDTYERCAGPCAACAPGLGGEEAEEAVATACL